MAGTKAPTETPSKARRTKAEQAQDALDKATARHDKAVAKRDALKAQVASVEADVVDAAAEVEYRRKSRHLDGGATVLDGDAEQPATETA